MTLSKSIEAQSAARQLEEFRARKGLFEAKLERFEGVEGYDVYNPSVPFTLGGRRLIAGRVERRASEDSVVRFFEEKDGGWHAVPSERLRLQDPFVTVIDGEVILGGVRVEIFPTYCIWTTDFYRMRTPFDMERIASGPRLMKDIRLLQMSDGRIAVFTRPQGDAVMKKYGCVARIGLTVIDSLKNLTAETIEKAALLTGQFLPDEWGGCNQLFNLKNGLVGVIGHKACRTASESGSELHYYGMAFCIDPDKRAVTQPKIICERSCFPAAEAKRPDLGDVTFTSGIERLGSGRARLFTGLSDACVGSAIIDDPFDEYEKE